MKLTLEGTPEEIKTTLTAITSSNEGTGTIDATLIVDKLTEGYIENFSDLRELKKRVLSEIDSKIDSVTVVARTQHS